MMRSDKLTQKINKRLVREISNAVLLIIATAMMIGGYIGLFVIDWKIGLFIFVLQWGVNVSNAVQRRKDKLA